jgi:ribose 5-phosphate isomerase
VFPLLQPAEVPKLHAAIKLIPGVVETGLFTGAVSAVRAYFGMADGSVEVWDRKA